ncbi:MAG: phage holin family protein, partial [Pseudomonadota bacterium]
MRTLLSEVIGGMGRLVRGELMLAKAEATEGVKAAVGGLIKMVVAAIIALVGLNVLAGAAVAALAAAGLGPAWAAVIVGIALCVLAVILALAGKSALRLRGVMPDRVADGGYNAAIYRHNKRVSRVCLFGESLRPCEDEPIKQDKHGATHYGYTPDR